MSLSLSSLTETQKRGFVSTRNSVLCSVHSHAAWLCCVIQHISIFLLHHFLSDVRIVNKLLCQHGILPRTLGEDATLVCSRRDVLAVSAHKSN